MLLPFFEQAGRSVSRQRTFRQLLVIHVLLLAGTILLHRLMLLYRQPPYPSLLEYLGLALLLAGVVEGALTIGWRMSQLPKTKFLEPLLLTPVATPKILLGEQLVGAAMLLFFATSAIPVFTILVVLGWLSVDQGTLVVVHAAVWSLFTGLGLTTWAYEPAAVRRWGGRFFMAMLLVYLVVGGLMGERTFRFLAELPFDAGFWIRDAFLWIHLYNPFSLVHLAAQQSIPGLWRTLVWVDGMAVMGSLLFLTRSAFRLKGHYLERHYSPIADVSDADRGVIAHHPLSWWAVRRVSEYAGHINLYLAFAASALYSAFLLAGENWPQWMGQHVFLIMEMSGGVPSIVTVLVLLAAVPVAYQYGLWDSSIAARCQRLELLLLTDLSVGDYLHASLSASWHRSKGYLAAALLLLIAGWGAGRYPLFNGLLAVVAGVSLISLYFAVSFRFFAHQVGGTSLGFLLTVVFPLATWGLATAGLSVVAKMLPPGAIYYAVKTPNSADPTLWFGLAMSIAVTVILLRKSLAQFESELRRWYDQNSGKHT